MNILLRLKHWQLFILMFIPAFLSGQYSSVLWFTIYIGWIYSVANASIEKVPNGEVINSNYFKFSCLFILAYITIVIIIFDGGYTINQDNYQDYGDSLWVILPLHLYTMWSIMYLFYFASKSLMSAREGKIVGFDQSFGYFFGFWFFPIGIWFIQPKIQKIIGH